MSVASARCSVLWAHQSQILQSMTGGQPGITRLSEKMSVIPLRIQIKCPTGAHREGWKEKSDPLWQKPKSWGPSRFRSHRKSTPSGSGGQRGGQKNTTGTQVAKIEIQAKPPNLAETKEMPKDPRARVRGVAALHVSHPAAVAVAGAIRCPVQIMRPMRTEIMSNMS